MKPRAVERLKARRKAMQNLSGKLIPKKAKVKVVRGFKRRPQ